MLAWALVPSLWPGLALPQRLELQEGGTRMCSLEPRAKPAASLKLGRFLFWACREAGW